MKIYRLLSILTTLLNKDLVSAKDLAEKNEVSVKTIQRDIETLNMAGIPVFSEKGMKGGYGILDSYKLDTKLLSNFEVGILNSMLDGLRAIYDNKQLENLWEKFEYALDSSPDNEQIQMKVDLSPWNHDETVPKKVNILIEAIRDKSIVKIEYYNLEGISSIRKIEPYEMTMKNGRWYVNAYCLCKNDFRNFKVNRIKEIEKIAQHFVKREYITVNDEETNNQDGVKKVLRFNKEAYSRVVDIFNDDEISEMNEEYIIVRTYLRCDSWLLSIILSFSNQVEVLEPPSLINKVRDNIIKMNELYQTVESAATVN